MRSFDRWCAKLSLLLFSSSALAQVTLPQTLRIGSGPGQIGVQQAPNQGCSGPAALTAAAAGGVAVLDSVNQRIVVVASSEVFEIRVPDDVVEPSDLLATHTGFLVLGSGGEVVHLNRAAEVLGRGRAAFQPEDGVLRFVRTREGRVAAENMMGTRSGIDGINLRASDLESPGLLAQGQFAVRIASPTSAVATGDADLGALSALTLSSDRRIAAVRIAWAQPGQGALVALQQTQRLPEDATFVRLSRFNAAGRLDGEAFLDSDAFRCEVRRPFVRLTDGRVVTLAFDQTGTVSLRELRMQPPGIALPRPVATSSSAVLISESSGDALDALERMNGTSNVTAISLGSTTIEAILERARAALALRWTVLQSNYAQADVQNLCSPPQSIWRRPQRLDGKLGQEVSAPPYRWGGYVQSLDELSKGLAAGRLAGDVCTCRDANCVHPKAIGQDCSGFVSYAWASGTYLTTRSLPNPNASKPIDWADLAPGDIVNAAGSHVRLVERVGAGPEGPVVTVIESTTRVSCGGVCRRPYLQSELVAQGYRPFRRVNLTSQ